MTQIQHFKELIERDIFADHLGGEVYFSKESILELIEISQNNMQSSIPTTQEQIETLESHLTELIQQDSKEELINILQAQIRSLKEISFVPYGC